MTTKLRKSLRLMVTALLACIVACAVLFGGSVMRAHAAVTQPTGGKLTVSNLVSGDQVSLYKVATMTVNADNTVTNAWVSGFGADSTSIDSYASANDATKHTVANAAAAWADGKTATATSQATGTSLAFSGLDAGLYYVQVSNASNASIVYQSTLAPVNLVAGTDGNWSVATDATIALKKSDISNSGSSSGTPGQGGSGSSDQGFSEQVSTSATGTFSSSTNSLKTGDYAYFRVTVSVPKYYGAADRTFKVVDTLPEGISYDSIVSDNASSITKTQSGNVLTFDLSQVLSSNVDSFTFTYKVKLTATTPSASGFKSESHVVFSPNSYSSDTVNSASTYVTINAANIKLTRTDTSDTPVKLQGAAFDLYSGTTKIASGTTNENGVITFDTLVGAGSYTLKETKAPAGYAVAADTTVEVSDTNATGNKTVEVTVSSSKDALAGILPEAGGPGTIWLTIIGVIIVAISVAVYMRTRKATH